MNRKQIVVMILAIIIGLLVIIVGITFANSNSNFKLEINCTNGTEGKVYAGDILSCSVMGNVKDSGLSGINTTIEVDGNLKLDSKSIQFGEQIKNLDDSLLDIDNNSAIIIDANNFNSITLDKIELMTFNVTAVEDINSTGNIKLINTTIVYNNENEEVEEDMIDTTKEISISKIPKPAYLSTVTVDGDDVFGFESSKFDYDTIINANSVNIEATTIDEDAIITEGLGQRQLNYGDNNFTISTMSSTDVLTQYNFNIYRQYASTSLEILSVSFGDETLSLDNTILEQKLTVNSDTIEIEAIGLYNASVSGTGEKKLEIGNNVFEITVVSEDKVNTKIYTLNVYRLGNDSSVNKILVNNKEATLTNNEYEINVNNTNVSIDVNLNDTNASYKIFNASGRQLTSNSIEIEDGSDNKFEIVVLAENKIDTTTYILNIHELNSDNYLSMLNVDEVPFDFDRNIFEYNLTTILESVTISASGNDKSVITGLGTYDLQLGENSFNVVVTAEDESEKVYTLNITREEKPADYYEFKTLTTNEDKKYIYNIEVGTSLDDIISDIDTNGKVSIVKENNVAVAATGQKLRIVFDDNYVEYIIIVKGDINGDGEVKLFDLTSSLKVFKKKITLEDYQVLAVDFDGNGVVSLADVVNHLKYFKKHK